MGKALKQFKKNKIRVISSYLLVILIILSTSNFVFGYDTQKDVSNDNQDLTYTIFFDKPILDEMEINNQMFTRISMDNCFSHAEPGYPSLPVHPLKILLPQGKKISKIDVSGIKYVNFDDIILDKPIIPEQKPIIIGKDIDKVAFQMNAEVYRSQKPVIDKIYNDVDISYCRGYPILSLKINPVQYYPNTGEIFYYSEIKINLEIEENKNLCRFFRNNLIDKEWVKNLVINPEEADNYGPTNFPVTTEYSNGLCNSTDDYDYVIITTTAGGLDDWTISGSLTHNWTSLMNKHSADQGFNCNIVTIEEIVNCTDYWNDTALFNDTPAKIREFCKDAYQDWNTSYVLIGGDVDIIPAREMDYAYESDVEADIYWSNLDNNFNADQDTNWGEAEDGGFDLYSELYIGRLPCDEPQDISNWMNKSFTYADSISTDYLDNAGFYGGNTGWDTEGDDFVEFSAIEGTSSWYGPSPGNHGSYPNWLGFQYGFETWNSENPNNQFDLSVKWTGEPANAGWSGGNEAAAINGLLGDINSNKITLLSGIAHADESMSLDVASSSWESNYHNTMPFLIHDYGCHCGDMSAADDGVLHSMLFHSDTELAFACIYNTGFGWGSEYDTNSSSALQQKLFWDYFFDLTNNSGSTDNWQLGKAMAYSKDSMAPTINWTYGGAPGSWRCTIQSCLLFGDPAQKLKSPSQNITLTNENPANGSTTINPGNIPLGITVNDHEGDTINITFRTNETGNWEDIGINSSQQNGTYYQNYEFNNYSTEYWWSVNATDTTGHSGWKNQTYQFTTRPQYTPSVPNSFIATTHNRSAIDLTWNNDGSNNTYIEWNTTESWDHGEGNLLDNSTNTSYQHTGLSFNTKYYYQAWSWNSTDNIWSISNTSSNDTTSSNSLLEICGVNPSDNSENIQLYTSCNVTISDTDLDSLTVYFYENTTGNWFLQQTNSTVESGTNIIWGNYSNASICNTTYWWSVNCTDGYNWTNETYSFTTRTGYIPSVPNSFIATTHNRSAIDLTWNNDGSNNTYIEWNTTESWDHGEGNLLDNSTNTSYQHTGLSFNTKYYYQAWSWNSTDNIWSNTNTSCNNSTSGNSLTIISGVNPLNNSENIQRYPSCNITITDADQDSPTVYFYENLSGNWCVQQINENVSSGSNIIWNNFSNASSCNTTYWWSVNCTDGYNWTNETYSFNTIENQAPTFSSISPSNESTGVSISTSTLSLIITDPEDDLFNWTITTSPNVGSNSGLNNSTGSKSCSISGLSYSTSYNWYVSAIDTVNGTWSNESYIFTTESQPQNPAPPYTPPPNQNNNPSTPSTPEGTSEGTVNTEYSYKTSTTDSDSDKIQYKIDWGDGTTSDWTDLIDPGTTATLTHSWSSEGVYSIKAKAKDEKGGESIWSTSLSVAINDNIEPPNNPDDPDNPENPDDEQIIVDIPKNVSVNESVVFDFVELNDIKENLTYHWNFGDGNTGSEKQPAHMYSLPGTYMVVLTIYDENGTMVNSTIFEITIDEQASSESQTTGETNQKQNSMPLLIISFIGGIIILCILFIAFRKSLLYKLQRDETNEPNISHIAKFKADKNKIPEYRINPKNAPPDMLTAYNHDIVKIKTDQILQKVYVENQVENIKPPHFIKPLNKHDLKNDPKKNKEK